MDELERLEQLKGEAIANPLKKAKGCKSCKKKKDQITEVKLPDPFEVEEYIPSKVELQTAFVAVSNPRGINDQDKPLVTRVYKAIFKEDFDYYCASCMSKSVTRLLNYLKTNKII